MLSSERTCLNGKSDLAVAPCALFSTGRLSQKHASGGRPRISAASMDLKMASDEAATVREDRTLAPEARLCALSDANMLRTCAQASAYNLETSKAAMVSVIQALSSVGAGQRARALKC